MRILNGLGDSQQLLGAQMLLNNGNRGTKRRRKAKKKSAVARVKKRVKARAKGKRKMVKGSAEAKAFMARLRKMRKK